MARPLSVSSGSIASTPGRLRAHGAAERPPVRTTWMVCSGRPSRRGPVRPGCAPADPASGPDSRSRRPTAWPKSCPCRSPSSGSTSSMRGRRAVREASASRPISRPGRDRAADVGAVAGDAVERRGGPEIHDDRRRAVQPRDGQAVDEPVRADFGGPLVPDRHRHDRRRRPTAAACRGARPLPRHAGQGRHDRGQRRCRSRRQGRRRRGGAGRRSGLRARRACGGARCGPPGGHDRLAVDEAQGDVGVADIEREQHAPMIPPRRTLTARFRRKTWRRPLCPIACPRAR